jgi:hypothetical protein
VSLATYLFLIVMANPSHALSCLAEPERPRALVDTGLSSIRTPIEVYADPETDECHAMLRLSVEALPSRNLVPVPRELARELVPVAKAFGARTCEIAVWTIDDGASEEERYDEDACRRGSFRYDGGSWTTIEDDKPCW